jgi:lipopolysaccharide/colanic/teichoic acid biosynthesis glycosyltransferase
MSRTIPPQSLPQIGLSAARRPRWATVAKRASDLTGAAIGLVVLSPLLVVLALAVRISSPGPILYRGLRTGMGQRPFRIFKFRSMVANAEQVGGTTTGKNDPRLTGIGRFLRKYKFDELPQLLNVLMGDMSFVGPRPEVAEYTDQYTVEERAIFSVRPGITDLACLEFHDLQEVVGSTNPDEVFRTSVLPRKIALRLKYVQEQSLTGDFRILLRTLWLVSTKPLLVVRHD